MAKYTNYTVIYIEYRLIPEHKYPSALNDSYDTTLYLIRNHIQYKIDLNNLILMGDSAGGNLATVISQSLSYNKIVKPKLQILIYPLLQLFDFTLPSYRINLPKRVLGNIDHEKFKHFLHYFTGVEVDDSVFFNGHTTREHKESVLSKFVNSNHLPLSLRDESADVIHLNDTEGKYEKLCDILLSREVSPLLVKDEFLKENTPEHTFLLTTEIDILRDDGFIYAKRLKDLGLNIEHKHYDNLFHGVFGLLHGPISFDIAHDLVLTVVDYVKKVIVN
jgi:acetyl esterase/lipase